MVDNKQTVEVRPHLPSNALQAYCWHSWTGRVHADDDTHIPLLGWTVSREYIKDVVRIRYIVRVSNTIIVRETVELKAGSLKMHVSGFSFVMQDRTFCLQYKNRLMSEQQLTDAEVDDLIFLPRQWSPVYIQYHITKYGIIPLEFLV
jgi:hypothetical protein